MARRGFILGWILAALLVLPAGPAAGQDLPDLPDLPELDDAYFADLDAMTCTDLNGFAYWEVPRFVLDDRPDLLYEFVLYWEDRCLDAEPVFRTRLLGSLWDGEFDESQYDQDVIDQLIDRYDPPVKSKYPELRKDFDDFTVTFADQLLPHMPRRSLEEFFCLFYAGKTREAWDLLAGDDLKDTWLRSYYDQEMEVLTGVRAVPTYAVTGGRWWPRGQTAFVGSKPLGGVMVGFRWPRWLLRAALEMRVGRSDQPYWVDEQGVLGRSDRFNATLLGVEFGRILVQDERFNVDLFLGVGEDDVLPFKEEEEVHLAAINISAGLGSRLFLGAKRNKFLGVDVRHEWIGRRNENAASLSGGAWSVRVGLGYAAKKGDARRLKGLGR